MRDAWVKIRGWLLDGCWKAARLLRWRAGQWWALRRQLEHTGALVLPTPRRRR